MDAVLQDWPDFMTSLHDLTCFGIPLQITKENFEFTISKECFQASWLIQICPIFAFSCILIENPVYRKKSNDKQKQSIKSF